ncbi:MAG: hypothetical protein K0B85_07885 [Coriobacteriia bacterium]|nr:hypothetical protein [Coriobacteriia bacterium]
MKKSRKIAVPLLLASLLIMSMVGSAAFSVVSPEECAPCGDWESYPLYAGQDWLVGEVLVNNCEDKVCVQYVLDDEVVADDFGITEVHLAIGSDFSDIPQTKKGNPIPGQFEVNESFDSGVPNTSVYCFEYEGAPGEELIIAAHAVVARDAQTQTVTHELCVFSGVDTEMEGEGDIFVPAVHTWVHPNWNPSLTEPLDDAAKWIWSSYEVEDPRNGGLVDFFDEFEVVGTPTGATLKIAADNAFAVSVNGNPIAEVNLAGDWRDTSTFGLAYVPDPSPAAWSIVHTYTFDLDEFIGKEFNQLEVTAVNAAYNTDSPRANPGGVRYELCITSEEEVVGREAASETAWGGTERMVSKGNWATYMEYTIKDCEPAEPVLVDTVQVFAKGAEHQSIALAAGKSYLLEASGTYRFANWGEYGIADAAWNHRRAANAPGGVAGWYQQESTWLQVWVDGAAVDWDPDEFNSEHIYTVEVTGADSPVVFKIMDDYYADNSGFITVDIYELP